MSNVILGVIGSIAAYRSPDLVSAIRRSGHEVRTILTPSAEKFVTRMAIEAMARNPVFTDEDNMIDGWKPAHIELADWAEIAVIAPATAKTIGKVATGIADGLLCEAFLALRPDVKKLFAPAMNGHMLSQSPVQRNINKLEQDGYTQIMPRVG